MAKPAGAQRQSILSRSFKVCIDELSKWDAEQLTGCRGNLKSKDNTA
jgi:hypothetical protein